MYKLAISLKPIIKKTTFVTVLYVVFLYIFFKSFVHQTRSKFVNKENGTVVKITSTQPLGIRWNYKLVKDHRHRSAQCN